MNRITGQIRWSALLSYGGGKGKKTLLVLCVFQIKLTRR